MKNPSIQITVSPEAQTIIDMLKGATKNSPTGVSFISIKGYSNKFGEISNQIINVGKNLFDNAKKKDIQTLKDMDIINFDSVSDKVTLEKARVALINGFTKPNKIRSNAQYDAYTPICEGLKVHNQTGEIYVYGLRKSKTITTEGDYPEVNSKPLTIAKDELKKELKSSKYVQLKVSEMIGLSGNGDIIEFM